MAADLRRTPGWLVVSIAAFVLLAVLGGRYGLHRDELYFIEAGSHPAWGYADQPPLVPLLATWWYDVVGGSLVAFRLFPALVGALGVALTAATAQELGGGRHDMLWAAVVMATATTTFVTSHLFGTTALDVTLTAAVLLLLLRAVRLGTPVSWLLTGLVSAVALNVKTLPATVLLCCALALLVVGPRHPFRAPWAYAAALVASAGAAPGVAWQQANGWPQLALAAAIADGGSGTSVDRAVFVPMLLTLTGPLTAGLLVVGAVALWRERARRWAAVAVGLLLVAVLVSGGKPYYLLGVVPLLIAAGVPACGRWAARGPGRRRGATLATVVAVNAVVGAFLALPLLPARLAPVAVIYDHGEQVGWAELVGAVQVAAAHQRSDIVLTANYGQAGALDRARRPGQKGTDLPPVYSGHNAYAWWGPPGGEPDRVLTVGRWSDAELAGWFETCTPVGSVENLAGVDNDEDGVPLRACSGPIDTWQVLWTDIRRLG